MHSTRSSDGAFGAFQQKIRAMLLSSKDSTKTKTNSINVNHISTENQDQNLRNTCFESTSNSVNADNIESTPLPQSLSNNCLPNTSTNSQSFETDNSIDEENDSFYIRDVCSKWFGQKQNAINQSFSSQMVSAVNKTSFLTNSSKLSHNMKSSLSEKVVTKDSICQNTYINGNYDNNSVNGLSSNPIQSVDRQLSCGDITAPNYVPLEGHVVVVSGLECDINRSNSLTVRSEVSSNQMSPSVYVPTQIQTHIQSYTEVQTHSPVETDVRPPPLEVHNVSEIRANIETVSSPEHNYKSSSDSGRGTIRRSAAQNTFKTNSSDGISPLDLTSLDSDQSTHNGVSNDSWLTHNTPIDSPTDKITNNETIEKMQRELQRILSDNHSTQSIEADVQDLSRNFQTRLSVVNESDSWTSNTPSQTPQPQQKPTTTKYCETKGESKYSSKGLTSTSKTYASNKSNHFPNELMTNLYNKPKIVSEKQKYSQHRSSKPTQLSNSHSKRTERSTHHSNKI